MTLVLTSVFEEGKLVLSDSRASSGDTSEDILQKIVGINSEIIVGYAGDVSTVNRVLEEFQNKIIGENGPIEQSAEVLKGVCVAEYSEYSVSTSPNSEHLVSLE